MLGDTAVAIKLADVANINERHAGVVLELQRVVDSYGFDFGVRLGDELLDALFDLHGHLTFLGRQVCAFP